MGWRHRTPKRFARNKSSFSAEKNQRITTAAIAKNQRPELRPFIVSREALWTAVAPATAFKNESSEQHEIFYNDPRA
jgi:hypothetical protein